MDYYKIGQRIPKIRKAHRLSQEELAEQVNITTTHMNHIETGNTKLSLQVLVDIKIPAALFIFQKKGWHRSICPGVLRYIFPCLR